MSEGRGVAMAILGVVVLIAAAGLVLQSNTNATGNAIAVGYYNPVCHPFERQCLTATKGQICDQSGTWQPLTCSNSFCSTSKVTKACVACRTTADCPAGRNCKAGQCITPQVCTPFAKACLSLTAGKICNVKGTSWNNFDCAPNGQVCSPKAGAKPCVAPAPVLYPAILR